MKTFNCWLIANALPLIVIVGGYCVYTLLKVTNYPLSSWELKLILGSGATFSIIIMIYTFCNIEEVLSRRFLWGNSNVDRFSYSLTYTIGRGIFAFFLPGIIYMLIALFIFMINENKDIKKTTNIETITSNTSVPEKKDIEGKELVMICEHIEDEGYFFYHPEQYVPQNEKNTVYLSNNGIKIKTFTDEDESLDTHFKNRMKYHTAQGWTITYKRLLKKSYFLSGIMSDNIIYYQKTVKIDSGKYCTIRIEYPASEKKFGDEYIKYYIKYFPEQI